MTNDKNKRVFKVFLIALQCISLSFLK